MTEQRVPDISICILSLNARDYLKNCIESIYKTKGDLKLEIIVVDNHSQDQTYEMLDSRFPEVIKIRTDKNLGFPKPMNKALKVATGKSCLLLNPDTIIHEHALDRMYEFLFSSPEIGIVGPKVLNDDGSLQKPCRRSEARPWDVFAYFTGLNKLFPNDPRFTGYYLGYRDEDEIHEADGVAGSCMLIRKEVLDQIGYLDERFFAYQEDADYCLRTRKAGWEVYYFPKALVTHFGGKGGSKVEPVRSIVAWHKSYWLYYRKHFSSDYFFLFNWVYYGLMFVKFAYTLARSFLHSDPFAGSRKPG